MKNLTFTLIILLISTTCLFAQEKSKLKNVQEETITKTIVKKGVNEEVIVTETVKKEKQIIDINDTGVENQDEIYSTKKNKTVNETKTVIKVNKENEAALSELKKAEQKEIEESKKAQLLKYEAERKAMEEKRPEKYRKKNNEIDN